MNLLVLLVSIIFFFIKRGSESAQFFLDLSMTLVKLNFIYTMQTHSTSLMHAKVIGVSHPSCLLVNCMILVEGILCMILL